MRSNWVEWAALGLSVLAIGAVVGFLVYDGLTNGGTRAVPSIELNRDEAYQTELGWMLPATLHNDGDAPAERVVLEASARIDGERQTSTVEVDFLPSGTDVEVFFGFSAEAQGEVTVRVVGFLVP
jgi:uncharacterized protein (TIGR02588 family)